MANLAEQIAREAERSVQQVRSYDVTGIVNQTGRVMIIGAYAALSLYCGLWLVFFAVPSLATATDYCTDPPPAWQDVSCGSVDCLSMKTAMLNDNWESWDKFTRRCQPDNVFLRHLRGGT